MKKYNIYYMPKNQEEYINLSEKIVISKDSSISFLSIPFLNFIILLINKAYLGSLVSLALSMITSKYLITIVAGINFGQMSIDIGFNNLFAFIFGLLMYLAMGIVGNLFYHRQKLKTMKLLTCLIAKNKKDALMELSKQNLKFIL